MRVVRETCPAKLNLFLEVLGRRPDGYHDLATVMIPVSLADSLEVREARRFSLEVEGARLPRLNTLTRAWRAVRRRHRIPGARVRLVKRIPAGSGLGGGSSDAAGLIRALDVLYGLDLDRAAAGAEVGSDVNFFFAAGAALCTGRGENVARITARVPLHAVIAWPGVSLSTAAVYSKFQQTLTRNRRSVINFLNTYDGGGVRRIGRALFNRLETPAFALKPGLRAPFRRFRRLPFAGSRMTGSGSAFFGLCSSKAQAEKLARRAVADLDAFVAPVRGVGGEDMWRLPGSGSS